ncbi:periplasmic substrate-binding transporter [Tepidanaerobacter syntrophicus]|uniref:TRAP transporter substrate-binding protein n=1 Tax=Tepidanaerobacter syntrophicus TaxID=224999 RepID=UPI0022EFC397|nr:TRAP transporter substrate-binding protein [Tepidanaerobacter syntrophicus]GLI50331.1 periplasmic substrate-binding transporter [Tepidanaerobacter syntrophicus]
MKKHIILLLIILMLITSIAISGCSNNSKTSETSNTSESAQNEVLTFKFAMVDNESSNYYKGAKKIAEEVAKSTNGKINIEVVAGGALGDERSTVELAMNGDLDIATAANSVLTNWIPEMSILDQAYLWDNADQAHAAVDGEVGNLIEAKAEELGLHVIGYMESGFRNVFSKKPIKDISDFKGVKIRTMQNEYHMAAFESFGAMPVAMPAGEQFTALQQGTIDACENAISNCLANGFYEVTKNITYTNHAFVYIIVAMSDNAWDKIPEDLREPFLEGVKKGYEAQRQYLVEANTEAEKKLKELGVAFHTIDTNVLKAAYKETAAKRKFTFDPEWQAAVDKAIASVNN